MTEMSEDDEDWFERALTQDESETTEDGPESGDASTPQTEEPTDGDDSLEFDEGDFDGFTERDFDAFADPETDAFGDASNDNDDDGSSLFNEDFGSALENAPDIPVDEGGESGVPGGSSGVSFVSSDEADFDDEIDSDLPRFELGIEGLDRMIQGGVPERSLMTAIGGAGTGKTTFGLQFLNHGLAQGERGVYITLEESHQRVVNSATEKGFPFDEYLEEGRLAIVDLDPVEMANSLASIRSELPTLVEGFGASRLVLDSVSLLEMMYDERATRRNEVYDFTESLKDAGVTALLTSEASERTPYASRHGIVEYLTDAVFVLQYVRPDDFRETRLAIEIQKIRDANHSREKKPYEITDEGISVYQQANLF
ncbi:putative circadian clock protein, KaiC [Natrarchaeobaculum sulfurireducens]|uniref:Putative circadian clock protein, KaiC n=2 Tax=Natrarchaeobaculum sulfurireducens TaxID=2044521 RepID=A0A346PN60_9EURY|nr:putative circadian clock protein, KaiC [Natrarchaeobaculum sulfurireducens]